MESITGTHSDDRLMGRMAEDDQEALATLIARWQNRIFIFAQRMVGNPDIAEDITQETFWRLWQARERYNPAGRFSAYLFQIAARLAMQHWRQLKARPPADRPLTDTLAAPGQDNPHTLAREAEMRRALAEALERLPAKQRTALELSRLDGMTQAEVANILGCSTGAVEQLIYRARQELRERMKPWLE